MRNPSENRHFACPLKSCLQSVSNTALTKTVKNTWKSNWNQNADRTEESELSKNLQNRQSTRENTYYIAINSNPSFIDKTRGKSTVSLFKRVTCRFARENTRKMRSNKNPYNKHWEHTRKHVQNANSHKTPPKTRQIVIHLRIQIARENTYKLQPHAVQIHKTAKSSGHSSTNNIWIAELV